MGRVSIHRSTPSTVGSVEKPVKKGKYVPMGVVVRRVHLIHQAPVMEAVSIYKQIPSIAVPVEKPVVWTSDVMAGNVCVFQKHKSVRGSVSIHRRIVCIVVPVEKPVEKRSAQRERVSLRVERTPQRYVMARVSRHRKMPTTVAVVGSSASPLNSVSRASVYVAKVLNCVAIAVWIFKVIPNTVGLVVKTAPTRSSA